MAKEFNIQGGYFSPPGYLKVETGGSHDENPNGGVQIGVDPNGVPNMLEEGEPVYDDYVYSDNITADKAILEQFNIPEKYAGKLYSEIADTFVDEAEDRPLDPISNNGLRAMLGRLADAQEQQKQDQEQKELEDELANMSPEELAELEAMMYEQQDVEQPAEIMALGGPMNKFDGGSWMTRLVPDNLATMRYKLRNGILPDIKPLAIDRSLFAGVPLPSVTPVSEPEEENTAADFNTLPTWMRYAGALGHGLLALSNAVTPQTRFTLRQARPYYPTGRINLIDPTYNPIDFGLTENAILASGAGTVNALRNSGLGPSTIASIIAADRNLGQNLGMGFLQNWDANNKQRNEVIAARNNNAVQRANFNYQVGGNQW